MDKQALVKMASQILSAHPSAERMSPAELLDELKSAFRQLCEDERTAAPPVASGYGRRLVLLADDEPSIRNFGRTVLEKAGYEVLLAADGPAAIEAFRCHREAVSAAVLDYAMPGMTGVEAFRELRSLRPDLPVLFCSGYVPPDAAERLRRAGVSIVGKPFLPEELVAAVGRLLRLQAPLSLD